MRIAMVLTPPSDHHFRLAAQIGVTDFVARYEMASDASVLAHSADLARSHGLTLSVVEGYIPFDQIIRGGANRKSQIDAVIALIRNMGAAKVPILCYNFMPYSDMTRTSYETRERGGALTSSFDSSQVPDIAESTSARIAADQLWENLEYFLRRAIPAAEDAGVALAMHPDDPPVPILAGCPQIMGRPESFERLYDLAPSPANGMCYCQGVFAEIDVDIPATIRRLASLIRYAHFRDVRGTADRFTETFHDNGKTDMFSAMLAYRDIGFTGPMRPDHVPKLDGEEGVASGYTMLGRLFAVGYMRGLMHAVDHVSEFAPLPNLANLHEPPGGLALAG